MVVDDWVVRRGVRQQQQQQQQGGTPLLTPDAGLQVGRHASVVALNDMTLSFSSTRCMADDAVQTVEVALRCIV